MKVLIINPGATSTKIAVFDEETELYKHTIDHDAAKLAPFPSVIDQKDYRKALIMQSLADALRISRATLYRAVGKLMEEGVLTKDGRTYRITDVPSSL